MFFLSSYLARFEVQFCFYVGLRFGFEEQIPRWFGRFEVWFEEQIGGFVKNKNS